MAKDKSKYQAVVEKVVSSGPHGPYVVAKSPELGSITFSLKPPVWKEDDRPEPGSIVVLSGVWKKTRGWRAKSARLFRPDDEH